VPRPAFTAAGQAILSVESKKKELSGDCKNAARAWRQDAEVGTGQDFGHQALGRAGPYGLYDRTPNRGPVYVGSSGATAPGAVAALAQWWPPTGPTPFPQADHLLLLADGGGSKGCRTRLWQQHLQERLCDALRLTLTVCHYPTGGSKWTPSAQRLCGPISLNGAGYALRTWDTILAFLRGSTTATGQHVQAGRRDGVYDPGRHVWEVAMATLHVTAHDLCPTWTYTLRPRHGEAPAPGAARATRELMV
jgi:Rhodopirellula transposase DDE domain